MFKIIVIKMQIKRDVFNSDICFLSFLIFWRRVLITWDIIALWALRKERKKTSDPWRQNSTFFKQGKSCSENDRWCYSKMLSIHLQASHIWSNSCILHSSFLLGAVVLFFHALPFPSSSFPPPLSHPHIISSFSVDPIHVFSPHAGPQTDSKQSCFPLKMFVPQAVIPGMRGVIAHSEHSKARLPCLTHRRVGKHTIENNALYFFIILVLFSSSPIPLSCNWLNSSTHFLCFWLRKMTSSFLILLTKPQIGSTKCSH